MEGATLRRWSSVERESKAREEQKLTIELSVVDSALRSLCPGIVLSSADMASCRRSVVY